MKTIIFTVMMKAQPQGSMKAFVVGGRAILTSDNAKMKPFRAEVKRMALASITGEAPVFASQVPVRLVIRFQFVRPASAKKRPYPSVKPDIDKLQRAVLDALTGVIYKDDSQVVEVTARKSYGLENKTTILIEGFDHAT